MIYDTNMVEDKFNYTFTEDLFKITQKFIVDLFERINITNYEISKWRWDLPEFMVRWIHNGIGRNIIIYIDFISNNIETECNAWIDNDEVVRNKINTRRRWIHKKISKYSFNSDFKIKVELQEAIENSLEKAFNFIKIISFDELNREFIIYTRLI